MSNLYNMEGYLHCRLYMLVLLLVSCYSMCDNFHKPIRKSLNYSHHSQLRRNTLLSSLILIRKMNLSRISNQMLNLILHTAICNRLNYVDYCLNSHSGYRVCVPNRGVEKKKSHPQQVFQDVRDAARFV